MMDILDKIDDVTAPVCGWCSQPLADDGPSLDFCTPEHQQVWTERLGEPIVGYREAGLGGMDWEAEAGSLAGTSPMAHLLNLVNQQQAVSRWWTDNRAQSSSAEVRVTLSAGGFDSALATMVRAADGMSRAFQAMGNSIRGATPSWTLLDETHDWQPAIDPALWAACVETPDVEPGPVSPAQAALEARRNRNTGPAPRRRRAPKNIGWGRP